jgi:chemotaxis protein methyltransferase CheR
MVEGKQRRGAILLSSARIAGANLNEPMANFGNLDVILLRNVMIYFDARTKERVIRHLAPSLKPGGYLIIGHCDTLAGVTHSLSMCNASIYRNQST